MVTPVSVLIPVYNRGDALLETLDSVLGQTHPPAEVIVVDDGSSDNTREVVARLGSRVRYHYRTNGGICRARNTAASLAVYQHIAFCDHDDLWRQDKLSQQMTLFQANPAIRYSFTNFALVTEEGWAKTTKFDEAPTNYFLRKLSLGDTPIVHHDGLYEDFLDFLPVFPSSVVMRRDYFNAIGGFREEFGKNSAEDLEFTLRCVMQGPIGIVRQPVVGIRKHGANFSGNLYKNVIGELDILRYVLRGHMIGDATRARVMEQIHLRSVEAVYEAFRCGDFATVRNLLADVPDRYIDWKTRLKLLVSRLPAPLADLSKHIILKRPQNSG